MQEAFAQAAKDIHSKFSSSDPCDPNAEGATAGGGAGKYDNATLGKRSRMRARAGGFTLGTVNLEQTASSPTSATAGARNVSGFSIRSLTGGGGGGGSAPTAAEGEESRAAAGTGECCVIC